MLRGVRIVGMHLDGEVVVDMNELTENREPLSVLFIHLAADEFVEVDTNDFLQGIVLQIAVRHDRILTVAGRYDPRFTTPHFRQHYRLKLQWIQCHLL